MKKIILLFLFIYWFNLSYSQDTATTNYFPLAVGNIYVYAISTYFPPAETRYKIIITKDTLVSGKRFFYCSQTFPGFNPNENWIRTDGITGLLTSLSSSNCNYFVHENPIDSLRSKINDSLHKCNPYTKSICIDTLNNTVFGIPTKRKVFRQDGLILNERTYSKNFGLTISSFWEFDNVIHFLRGCKINGTVYGDTLLTGINQISSEVPAEFTLYQNYPNPFNPLTKIKLDIPSSVSFPNVSIGNPLIVLKIFDVTGKEVATLVNEQLAPGTYTVDFDGTNFPSGVYFYQLRSEYFTETKKLVLIK
jgi:hypothetical protein